MPIQMQDGSFGVGIPGQGVAIQGSLLTSMESIILKPSGASHIQGGNIGEVV